MSIFTTFPKEEGIAVGDFLAKLVNYQPGYQPFVKFEKWNIYCIVWHMIDIFSVSVIFLGLRSAVPSRIKTKAFWFCCIHRLIFEGRKALNNCREQRFKIIDCSSNEIAISLSSNLKMLGTH